VSAFVFVVEPYVVHDQIAATPETLRQLTEALLAQQQPEPQPAWMPGLSTFTGLPMVPDEDLPPGEVHMRRASPIPFTRVEQDEVLRQMLDWYAEMMPDNLLNSGNAVDKRPV